MEDFIAMCSRPELIAIGIFVFGFTLGFAISTSIALGDYICQIILPSFRKK